MHDLHAHILVMAQKYSPEDKRDEKFIEGLVSNVADFHQWADILPDDEDTWGWIRDNIEYFANTSDNWQYRLSIIKLALFRILHQHRANPTTPLPPLYNQIEASLERIERLLSENLAATARLAYKISDQILPPQVILSSLWPFVYPELVSQPLSAFDVQDWPPVHYHPYRTQKLISGCIARLSGRRLSMIALLPIRGPETVHLLICRTAQFFELHLSVPARLFPAQWETLVRTMSDDLESLRELGGNLEPLTWDDGHGEGVIVKLPWENPA